MIWREASHHLSLFQVVPEGCEQVLAGRKIMQCLSNPADVKMALEVYKLSLEIELLELRIEKERKSNQIVSIFPKEGEKGTLAPSVQHGITSV